MHRQDGRQEIDRRTLLAKGAAIAALLVTGCARKESRGFAATSLRQLLTKAYAPILITGVVFGAIAGWVVGRWAGPL